jgi:hypothetical protein
MWPSLAMAMLVGAQIAGWVSARVVNVCVLQTIATSESPTTAHVSMTDVCASDTRRMHRVVDSSLQLSLPARGITQPRRVLMLGAPTDTASMMAMRDAHLAAAVADGERGAQAMCQQSVCTENSMCTLSLAVNRTDLPGALLVVVTNRLYAQSWLCNGYDTVVQVCFAHCLFLTTRAD